MDKLQDRAASVTRAGGGFGEGIARHVAALGARVVVADRASWVARSAVEQLT